jgi:hypothetical protein
VDRGIKASKEGYDVKTATDDQLIFTSKNNVPKIILSGTVNVTFLAGETDAYVHIFLSDYQSLSYSVPLPMGIGFGETPNGSYRTNINRSYWTDYISIYIWSRWTFAPGGWIPYITIDIERDSNSSTWSGAYTVPVKYFVML